MVDGCQLLHVLHQIRPRAPNIKHVAKPVALEWKGASAVAFRLTHTAPMTAAKLTT